MKNQLSSVPLATPVAFHHGVASAGTLRHR
jgi:hypothetical protein